MDFTLYSEVVCVIWAQMTGATGKFVLRCVSWGHRGKHNDPTELFIIHSLATHQCPRSLVVSTLICPIYFVGRRIYQQSYSFKHMGVDKFVCIKNEWDKG